MLKNISHVTAILLFGLVNMFLLPTQSNAQSLNNVQCRKAITNAENRLRKIPYVLIENSYTKTFESNFPQGRPLEYIFYLTAPIRNGVWVEYGIMNLQNSVQLMTHISQDIISNCESISAVTFGSIFAPACGITFGLMADGKVIAFEWVDIDKPAKWGESYCL